MPYAPQVVMPSDVHFEAPNGAATYGGAYGGLFRPPVSPSASSSIYLAKSTGSLYSDMSTPAPNAKRKRSRPKNSTPLNEWGMADDTNMDDAINSRLEPARRTSGGRELRYTLAGQIETPNGALQQQLGDMEDSAYSDVDYRRALGSKRSNTELDSPLSRYTAADSNMNIQQEGYGWSKLALNKIGGVVGKMWEFCKTGAFRGFYAGDGDGYAVSYTGTESNGQVWCNEHDVPTLPEYGFSQVPGGFPESDYSPFCYERETPEATPPHAAKRRQIFDSTPNDELRKNWVMVNDPTDKKRQSSFPHRALTARQLPLQQACPSLNRRINTPVSRLNVPIHGRTHSSQTSHAGAATLSNREPASFASPRSPVMNRRPATPSRLPVPTRPHSPNPFSPTRLSQQPSKIPNPGLYSPPNQHRGHRRTQSAMSAASAGTGRMRRRESTAQETVEECSPRLDPEAKKLAAKIIHEERAADARINDFNARLKEMIRQGKEALGTSIQIEGNYGGLDPWEDE